VGAPYAALQENLLSESIQEIVNFIWPVADEVLRDDFKRGKYPDIILPFTVLRRLDCVLADTKERVLARHKELQKQGIHNLDGQLRRAAGHSFYNISKFDFGKLLDDAKNIGKNLIAYINGFSENMRDVIDNFGLRNNIDLLDQKDLLFLLIKKFSTIDLHPDRVDNHAMGTIFEELIRKFNEQTNENPGEHFTPREVIRLMVHLVLNGDKKILGQQQVTRTVYDPACGSGGMLSIAKEYVLNDINPKADIRLFGQEVNPETYAVCKSDMLIKGDDRDADNVKPESSLSKDGHPLSTFDYMLTNPPYGKDWKKEREFIEAEAAKPGGRFSAGLPRISDGQLLFLQHMISKMKPVEEGGSRIAIVMNGSPLFTGDAGSGESEIRRWILENDWLETIVALPGELFYNTGINTYIWVLTNRKPKQRKGKVLLVNGAAMRKEGKEEVEVFAQKMRKSLGDKRNELSESHIEELSRLAAEFEEGPYTKFFDTSDFGYRKITVERPLRLNFQASSERINRLRDEPAFVSLCPAGDETGRDYQKLMIATIQKLGPEEIGRNRDEFVQALDARMETVEIVLPKPLKKAILLALSERDEKADICKDSRGNPESDPELRDYENVPLKEDINTYFDREVKPHVPDAWVNEDVRDEKDGEVGKVGYEVSFNRYFYQYEPPRPLEEIDADIKKLEAEILKMLGEVTQ
jgi:type I restriction enzyme M protein